MLWCIQAVEDGFKRGKIKKDDLSVRSLLGTKGVTGFLSLLVIKYELKMHLLGPFLDVRSFAPSVKANIRETYHSHASYMLKVHPLDNTAVPDLSFQTAWKVSGQRLGELLEGAIFGAEYDSPLRAFGRVGKASRGPITGVLESRSFQDAIAEIDAALKDEATKAGTGVPNPVLRSLFRFAEHKFTTSLCLINKSD